MIGNAVSEFYKVFSKVIQAPTQRSPGSVTSGPPNELSFVQCTSN